MRKLIIGLVLFGLVFATTSKIIFDGTNEPAVQLSPVVLDNNPPPSPLTINWVAMANSPAPGRYWCPGTGVVRDTIWFLGGAYSMSGSHSSLRSISAYVPETNTWVTTGLSNLLTTRRTGGGGRIGNKIYVVGGRDSTHNVLSSCEELDVDTKIVTTTAPMPRARYAVASAVANGKLYIIGDEDQTGATYEYNPTTDSWTTKTSIPVGRGWSAAAGAGGKVYLFGGGGFSYALNDCWVFDPIANTWTQRANMPGTRLYHTACALGDSVIYVLGGVVSGLVIADNIVYRYDIATNTWTNENSMPTSRGWLMANQVGNKIYATFGSNCATPPSYLTVNEEATFLPPPDNDVGVYAILSPATSHSINTEMIPRVLVKNYGLSGQTDFPVTCSIFGTADTLRYSDIRTVSLNAGDTVTVSFNNWTPTISEICIVKMRTTLPSDANPDNDIKIQATNITNNIIIGTATTNQGEQPMHRAWNYSTHEAIYLQSEINTSGNITHIAYYKHSGIDTSPIQNVTIYLKHTSASTLSNGNYNLTGYTQVYNGSFTNNATEGWMEVALNMPFSYNNTDNLQILVIKGYQDWLPTYPNWRYTTTSPNYRSRYEVSDVSQPTSLTATYNRPNFRLSISQPLTNDVGVDAILSPGTQHTLNIPMTPSALIRNYGTSTATNIKVYCLITGFENVVRFNDSVIINSLDSNATVNVSFSTWTPTIAEFVTVKMWTALTGDQNPANDLQTQTSNIMVVYDAAVTAITEPSETEQKRVPFIPQVTVANNGSASADIPVIAEIRKQVILLEEDFNDTLNSWPSPGWQNIIVNGTYSWERKLSNLDPVCVPYEGSAMASYPSYYAASGYQARLVSPAIDLGVTPVDLLLKFWMYHDPGYPFSADSVKIEYSTDGINFNQVSAFRRYASKAEWTEHTVNLGTLSGTINVGFLAFSGYGNNMNIDKVTLIDNTVVYQDSQMVTVAIGKASEEVFFRPCTLMIEYPYNFEAYTNLSGDMYPANDKMTRNVTVIPLTLTLTSPANDTIYNDNKPLFDWDAVTGAETYRIQVDNDTDFSSPAIDEVTDNDEWLVLEGSELGDATYYWHVRVESPGTPDPFSETWTLTINAILPPPILVSPADQETLVSETQTMVWRSVPHAVMYNLILGPLSVNVPETIYTAELPKGDYEWKVRTQGSSLIWGGFSAPWIFYVITPNWTLRESVPQAADVKPGKFVKDGGALVYAPTTKGVEIYGFPGNKSWKFYKYTPGLWDTTLAYIPHGVKPPPATGINKKKISKGAALCFDGVNTIYATKGNGTRELWKYDIAANVWTQDSFVPVPKALKGGTSLAYYEGKVYLLAGGQKAGESNFYIYDVATDAWTTGPALEPGPNNKVWKDGSCLARLGTTIYAIKGGDKFNPVYTFDGTSWTGPDSIPIGDTLKGKWKKATVKDGGAMCAGDGAIYAIKGGGTQLFWKWTASEGWTRLDTIPRLRKKSLPKTGAAMIYAADKIYLMKGNNTPEFWKYNPPIKGVARVKPITALQEVCRQSTIDGQRFDATPNPFSKLTTVRYTVPVAEKVTIKLYNASGRLVETLLANEHHNAGSYTLKIENWKLEIAKGIYFLKFESNTNRSELKLVIQ